MPILLLLLGFFFHLHNLLFKHFFMGLLLIHLQVDLCRRRWLQTVLWTTLSNSEVIDTFSTCFSIVSSTASQLSPLINAFQRLKNGGRKSNIIHQLKTIPRLKDIHNVANIHPPDVPARNKVHLTRKSTSSPHTWVAKWYSSWSKKINKITSKTLLFWSSLPPTAPAEMPSIKRSSSSRSCTSVEEHTFASVDAVYMIWLEIFHTG